MHTIADPQIASVVRKVEQDAHEHEWTFDVSNDIDLAVKRAEEINDQAAKQKLVWEFLLFRFVTKEEMPGDNAQKRFRPVMSGTTKAGENVEFPDINFFKGDSITYFKERARATKNLVLKARYADFIWEFSKEPEFAEMAADSYFQMINFHYQKGWMFKVIDALERCKTLVKIKAIGSGWDKKIKEKSFSVISQLLKDNKPRYCLEIIELLDDLPKGVLTVDERNKLIDVSEQCAENFFKEKNFHLQRSFQELTEKLLKSTGKKEESRQKKYDAAQSYLDEAQVHEQAGSQLVASHFIEEALKIYQQLGDKEKIQIMKAKLIQANRDSVKEFKTISTEIQIKEEHIRQITDPFIKAPSLDAAITLLAFFKPLYPDYDAMLKQTEEMKQKFPLQYLVSQRVIGRDGHLVSSDGDSFNNHLIQQTMIGINVGSIFLEALVERLIKEKSLDVPPIVKYLQQFDIFNTDNIELVRRGLERHFIGDYVSSLHILVPQIEALIRRLLNKSGVDVVTFERGKTNTQDAILSALIDREETKKLLGKSLQWYVKLVLVEKLGLNLRNEVAHGLISLERCNKRNSLIAIHILILLTKREYEAKVKGIVEKQTDTAAG